MIEKLKIKNPLQGKQKFKVMSGFTLIELLVVISIIGILAAMLTASFSEAQKSSRDAKRRGDLKSIQGALEQYQVTNSSYPGNSPTDYPTALTSGNYFQNNVVPTDPKTGSPYSATVYTTTAYTICATLEKSATPVCIYNLQ